MPRSTTLSIAGALTVAVQPKLGPLPHSVHGLMMAVLIEAGAGLLLGGMVALAMQAFAIAGGLAEDDLAHVDRYPVVSVHMIGQGGDRRCPTGAASVAGSAGEQSKLQPLP